MNGGGKGRDRSARGGSEQLAIFGDKRSRRGAELKIMSAVETKSPGAFTRGVREKFSSDKGFATDRFILKDDELSYALGKEGATRKKLELASGTILQYVGHVAFLAGDLKDRCFHERKRCKQFIDWLLAQRRGSVTVSDVQDRDDCTEMHIPENCKGWVTGNRGSELRRVEQATGTFMFMALDKHGEEQSSGVTPAAAVTRALAHVGATPGNGPTLGGGDHLAGGVTPDLGRDDESNVV
eukprot:g23853.t1